MHDTFHMKTTLVTTPYLHTFVEALCPGKTIQLTLQIALVSTPCWTYLPHRAPTTTSKPL